MSRHAGYLRLNRLRIIRRGHVAYDQSFHEGVNIIRGQNGSGKSTIADFIFFILGGEFDSWKDAASHCDEVQAEIETQRGKHTLRRQITSAQEPIFLYFGPLTDALKSSPEGWERFPIRRQGSRESFSQIMFHSLLIPEAQSEGASNITMHQVLRLCYSDQRTPAPRLFRFEPFDTHNIREAVGDLICGISGYEVYEIDLKLRDLQKELDDIEVRLGAFQSAFPPDHALLNTPELIQAAVDNLERERFELQQQVDDVDKLINPGEVEEYLDERRKAQEQLIRQREKLRSLELEEKGFDFELREIGEFVDFLEELTKRLSFAEATFEAVGSIEFSRCPACGEELIPDAPQGRCVVCSSPLDSDREKAKYNQIRLDLEIQKRESGQLIRQKESALDATRKTLRLVRREHKRDLSTFDLKYSGANGPREAFLATRINRLGHIDAQMEFLIRSLDIADKITQLRSQKAACVESREFLKTRNESLRRKAKRRREVALARVSAFGAAILRSDLPRQTEFIQAENVTVGFRTDSVSVAGLLNFAESSNVLLKNAAILGLFLAAVTDEQFYHPRFLLIDNVEDKGMEADRSQNFQRTIVHQVMNLKQPCQVIFTTSMMNPELELDDYTIGPPYTSSNRTLELVTGFC